MAVELSTIPLERAAEPIPATANASAGLIWTCLTFAAFVPMFLVHGSNLWLRPHYQFFPLVIAGSIALAWSRWREVTALVPGHAVGAILGVVLSWFLLVVAEFVFSPTLAIVSALVLLATFFYHLGGWPLMKTMAPAWFFLCIAIPLPFRLDRQLVVEMQSLTTNASSYMLDYFEVIHQLSGNVVEISGQSLFVEEACAGVNSLFAIVACCIFLILWQKRSWVRAFFLLAASVGWVLVTNVIRIVIIAIALDRYQIDLGSRIRHDLLGLACFLLAVLLIWSTDRLLLFFKPSWNEDRGTLPEPAQQATAFGRSLSFCTWPVAAAFSLLLFVHIGIHGAHGLTFIERSISPRMASIDAKSLPETLAGWKKIQYAEKHRDSTNWFGEFSKSWQFKRDNVTAVVSIDYPFGGFHDLWDCYNKVGWSLESRSFQTPSDKSAIPSSWLEVSMKRPGLNHGYLLFSEFTSDGEIVKLEGRWSETFSRYEQALNSLRDFMNKSVATHAPKSQPPVYQFQIFTTSSGPLKAHEQEAVTRLYLESVGILHKQLFEAK